MVLTISYLNLQHSAMRRVAIDSMINNKERYKTLVENIPVSVFEINVDGGVIFANLWGKKLLRESGIPERWMEELSADSTMDNDHNKKLSISLSMLVHDSDKEKVSYLT